MNENDQTVSVPRIEPAWQTVDPGESVELEVVPKKDSAHVGFHVWEAEGLGHV